MRFQDYLNEKLKDPKFARGYSEEFRLARMAVEIGKARDRKKMSQTMLAKKAQVTQQQLSKVENAHPCNVSTLMKVCEALDLEMYVRPKKKAA